MSLLVERFSGGAVQAHLDAVARLRATVFRGFPYLYEAEPDYEARYLAHYAASPGSVFVLAFDGDAVVGASTGIPLQDDDAAFRAPFEARGIDPATVFYFGESVLLPAYRGRGLGHAFFDHREAHARAQPGVAWTAFCAVLRAPDDPRRPPDHRDNDAFWLKRGYQPQPDMLCTLDWPGPGGVATSNRLRFWLRRW